MPACTILIPSTDDYSDLWRPCVFYVQKHWPDCPFPIVLGANSPSTNVPDGAQVAVTAPGIGWGDHVRRLVGQVDSPTVLLLMPDYFLTGPVDTSRVLRYLDHMAAPDAGCLRLVPIRQLRRQVPNVEGTDLVELGLDVPFSTSLAASFWSTRELHRILEDTDTPWTFEGSGALRRLADVRYYTTSKAALRYPNSGALVKGMWTRWASKALHRDGLDDALRSRPTQTRSRAVKFKIKSSAFATAYVISPRRAIAIGRKYSPDLAD